MNCFICIPCVLFTIFEDSEPFGFATVIMVGLTIGYYFITKDLFKQIPKATDTGTKMQGILIIFGGVQSFFTNLCNIYIWYALPVIYTIVLLIVAKLLANKLDTVIWRFVSFVLIAAILISGLPILMIFLSDVLGDFIAFIIGIALVFFGGWIIIKIIGSEFKSDGTSYTLDDGTVVTHSYGNVYKDSYGNYWEKDCYNKFTKR